MVRAMSVTAGPEHDYAHVFHAGNVGDVFKHVVLAAVLDELRGPDLTYIDTHSGEGLYTLRTTGEWAEGVLQLWRAPVPGGPGLESWLRVVRTFGNKPDRPDRYPGSPLLAARLLPDDARLELFETQPEAQVGLRGHLGDDRRAHIHPSDGFAGLTASLEKARGRRVVALIDPPYIAREDWTTVVRAMVDAHKAAPEAVLMLWYPVKSWSRPHVLVRAVREAGVPATAIDLVTTPIEHKRNRLNGSGLLCVNVPEGLVDRLCGVLPAIGRRCATRFGEWSMHVTGWRTPIV